MNRDTAIMRISAEDRQPEQPRVDLFLPRLRLRVSPEVVRAAGKGKQERPPEGRKEPHHGKEHQRDEGELLLHCPGTCR